MNKVLIIVGDATETVDTLYPYYRLQEDHFVPVVAAPEVAKPEGVAVNSEQQQGGMAVSPSERAILERLLGVQP